MPGVVALYLDKQWFTGAQGPRCVGMVGREMARQWRRAWRNPGQAVGLVTTGHALPPGPLRCGLVPALGWVTQIHS